MFEPLPNVSELAWALNEHTGQVSANSYRFYVGFCGVRPGVRRSAKKAPLSAKVR